MVSSIKFYCKNRKIRRERGKKEKGKRNEENGKWKVGKMESWEDGKMG
jgi:hypothetical protein